MSAPKFTTKPLVAFWDSFEEKMVVAIEESLVGGRKNPRAYSPVALCGAIRLADQPKKRSRK